MEKYLNLRSEENYSQYKDQRRRTKDLILNAKRNGWEKFGSQLEDHRQQNTKLFYKVLKEARVGKANSLSQMKDNDGIILGNSDDIMERWKSYFEELLEAGGQNSIGNNSILPIINIKDDGINYDEISDCLKKIKLGKAAGHDDIRPEMLKYLGENGIDMIHKICNAAWKTGTIPRDWECAVIIPIHKKGDNRECKNYRGISLLSTASKLYELILEAKLNKYIANKLEDSQSGFRRGYSTQDHIFSIRQLQEKLNKHNRTAYICFIDLVKAFDKVIREQVWEVLRKLEVEENLIQAIQSLYKKTRNYVRQGNMESTEFTTTEGLRQGGVLSPILFIILLDDVIKDVKNKVKSVNVGYKNLQQVRIAECAFADDIAICANSQEDMQFNLNVWNEALRKKNMVINTDKTKVMAIGKEDKRIKLTLDSITLEQVNNFKYLGVMLDHTGGYEEEINSRIKATANLYYSLNKCILNKKEVSKRTKKLVYKTIYLPTLTYGCESWVLTDRLKSKIQASEMKFLRRIEGVTRLDRIRNEVIRENLEIQPAEKVIEKQQLRWYGHMTRMKEGRQTKNMWLARTSGRRARGRPRKSWSESISQVLDKKGLSWREAGQIAHNRTEWRNFIKE